MKSYGQCKWMRNTATVIGLATIMSGCLSDEKDSTLINNQGNDNVELSGSVGDGPVVGANMRATSSLGELLAEFQSDSNAGYNITLTALSGDYPLIIVATGGIDIVTNQQPDFKMTGAAFNTGSASVANVSPFSTLAVALAENMSGGVTSNNLETAQETVSSALNCGLDSLAATGPMGTRIDAGNISEIVKASESLSEIVRRTRDLLQSAGFASSGDSVVSDLAADLPDGVVDGVGASAVDRRTAAVSTIVSAQVLLESMANELYVGDNDATTAMQSAIERVSPGSTILLDELPITPQMIAKARIGLAAAYALDPNPAIRQLHSIVSSLRSGQNGVLVRIVFPADYRGVLQNALAMIAGADTATLDLVNSIARSGGDLEASNLAPNIQGNPATSILVGSLYTFLPAGSDPDGDSLTFLISGKPAWASFDPLTGQLSGVPLAGDIGTHSNIVIGVSDGVFTTNLMPFSITVTASNSPPVISGSAATSVNAGETYSFAPTASDPDGDTLVFSIANRPSWASFDTTSGRISGTPMSNQVGTYANISVSVSDGQASATLASFSITVNAATVNTAPQISGTAATSVMQDQNYSFTPGASDADGDSLTFSVSGMPSWANFNTTTGRLRGTPRAGDVGIYSNIVISVSDGQANVSLPSFSISVQAVSLGSATLSWTAPTQNDDGTQLTDLAGYKLYWGTTSGSYANSVTINNPSVTTYLVENLSPGTYEFVATSYKASGLESRYSGTAIKVIP